MKPLVSVVTPTYNRAATIARAVDSVLAQDFTDFEYVIVDDGSTDATLDVLKTYQDARIRVISQPNVGEAAARNTGILASCGEFIAFLDSDDEWLPQKLTRQMDMLARVDCAIKACCCDYFETFPDRTERVTCIPQSEDWYRRLLMGSNIGPGTNLVVSRAAYDQVGYYDLTLLRHTDWDWLLRFTRSQYPLMVVNEPLSRVNRDYKSVARIQEQSARLLIRKHHDHALQYGRAFRARALTRIWLNIARKYAAEGNAARAAFILLRTIARHPLRVSRDHAFILKQIILALLPKTEDQSTLP